MQRYLNVEAEMPGNLIEINNEKLEKKRTLTATKDLGNQLNGKLVQYLRGFGNPYVIPETLLAMSLNHLFQSKGRLNFY